MSLLAPLDDDEFDLNRLSRLAKRLSISSGPNASEDEHGLVALDPEKKPRLPHSLSEPTKLSLGAVAGLCILSSDPADDSRLPWAASDVIPVEAATQLDHHLMSRIPPRPKGQTRRTYAGAPNPSALGAPFKPNALPAQDAINAFDAPEASSSRHSSARLDRDGDLAAHGGLARSAALALRSPNLSGRPALSRAGSSGTRDRSGSLSKRFSHQRSLSRSASQQLRRVSHRTSSGGFAKRKALSLEAKELIEVLQAEFRQLDDATQPLKARPLIIDVRPLPIYLGPSGRLRGSINCNFPSLLIKRFRKGKTGSFNIESFVTTETGKAAFRKAMASVAAKNSDSAAPPETPPNALKALAAMDVFVVDEDLQDLDGSAQGAVLVAVLEKLLETHVGSGSLCYLRGTFAQLKSLPAAEEWIVTGEESSGIEDGSSTDENFPKRRKEGLTIQPPKQALRAATNERDEPKARDRPRLKRIDTSEGLSLSNVSSPTSLSKRSNTPSPLLLDRNKSHLDESPARLVPRPESNLSIQELCRLQASTPSTNSFCPTSVSPARSITAQEAGDEPEEFIVSCIIPNFLYLGPDPASPQDVQELEDLGIQQILNMALELDDRLGLAKRFDKYTRIPMRDFVEEQGVQQRIDEACVMLDDADLKSKPVYVHCRAGKSRSVTIVLAYLIHRYHWPLKRAYAHVSERRKGISPNIGFISELMRFEERSLGKSKGPSGLGLGQSLPSGHHPAYRPHFSAAAPTGLEGADLNGPASARPSLVTYGRLRESMPPAMGANGEAFDYTEMLDRQTVALPNRRLQPRRAGTADEFQQRRASMR